MTTVLEKHYLDFEKPIADLEQKIEDLKHIDASHDVKISDEIKKLQEKKVKQQENIYSKLTAWQKVQIARHQNRPMGKDYLDALITDFTPLAGDRLYGEDAAIIGGIGRFNGQTIMIIAQERGHDVETRLKHNFGMARPEGYRKARRMMQLANHYGIPLVNLIDTSGAYPGIDGEARGQAEAIAKSMEEGFKLEVPSITIVIGEGGSGGAIALGVANKIMMLENSVYSVISPEACSSILMRTADKAKQMAEVLKLTAQDLKELGIIDEIIPEPLGGAHSNRFETIKNVGEALRKALTDLNKLTKQQLEKSRYDKFMAMTRLPTKTEKKAKSSKK